jgi:hypothetical protein
MTAQRYLALLITLTLFFSSRVALGRLAMPVKVDATVGLDQPTRDLSIR